MLKQLLNVAYLNSGFVKFPFLVGDDGLHEADDNQFDGQRDVDDKIPVVV
jgi:hypothetical protein